MIVEMESEIELTDVAEDAEELAKARQTNEDLEDLHAYPTEGHLVPSLGDVFQALSELDGL